MYLNKFSFIDRLRPIKESKILKSDENNPDAESLGRFIWNFYVEDGNYE